MKSRAVSLAVIVLCGCAALTPTSSPHSTQYSLDAAPSTVMAKTTLAAAPTLVVSPPYAAAGFDSPRMMYVRQAHKLEYFAHNEWTDTPARMLAPLIAAAAARSGAFRAVVTAPSTAAADLRLDTEVGGLQQEFLGNPSRVRFTLRANIVDSATRRVIASREFEAVAPAPSENPYGGVIAANEAVRAVLAELGAFCAAAASGWQPDASRFRAGVPTLAR